MRITDETPIAQNQKRARKILTFDFYPSCTNEKTTKIKQKNQNNTSAELSRSNFSNTKKGQCENIDLKLNIPSLQLLNKKEVCMN